MNENLCMGCMENKGDAEVCPFCGYSENSPHIHSYLAPRSIVGSRYLVGKVLSYNGEGVTYIGYDTIASCKIEIREYFPDTLADREPDGHTVAVRNGCQIPFKAYMGDFVDLMQKLVHLNQIPHLIQVQKIVEQNGTVYAIMEHFESVSLQQYLDRRGLMLNWTEASDLLLPVIRSLIYLHQEGIIHRGISASTVFLGKNGEIKIGGYGISAVRAARTELVAELYSGYSAPEQYSAVSPHGSWTDVYGISALLYTCVTGQCPTEALLRTADKEILSPRENNETIPPRVSAAILQGLAIQPENRIRTLSELISRIGGPFHNSVDSPTIAIPAVKPAPVSPKADPQSEPSSEKKKSNTTTAPRTRPVPSRKAVVQGTSDRRLLINSALITLPILLAILIFTFWYLFSDRKTHRPPARGDSSSSISSSQPSGFNPPFSHTVPSSSAEPSSSSSSSESSSEEETLMVNLVGQNYMDVAANPKYKQLCTFEEAEYIYSESDAAGIIIWQSVASDTPVTPDTHVRLKVSKGSQYVLIPPYEKVTEEDYTRKLTDLGINYVVSYKKDAIYPSGYVVGLDRMEGSKYDIEKASVIEVYVSSRDD